jgi:predicted amidohydrolase YtcJ
LKISKAKGLVIYDLRNQFVMPGMHDTHAHLLFAGEKKDFGRLTSVAKRVNTTLVAL